MTENNMNANTFKGDGGGIIDFVKNSSDKNIIRDDNNMKNRINKKMDQFLNIYTLQNDDEKYNKMMEKIFSSL
tara:strand:+ start:284 stop:502 length:219 start_codon:yes stop_codon:yes gene_type:complete